MYHYDKQGKPISLEKAIELGAEPNYRIVRQEFTPGGTYWISTVWLTGIDHSHGLLRVDMNPNPIIFETMVFYQRPEKQEKIDFSGLTTSDLIQTERYSTEQEALRGHQKLFKKYSLIEQLNKKRAR